MNGQVAFLVGLAAFNLLAGILLSSTANLLMVPVCATLAAVCWDYQG